MKGNVESKNMDCVLKVLKKSKVAMSRNSIREMTKKHPYSVENALKKLVEYGLADEIKTNRGSIFKIKG